MLPHWWLYQLLLFFVIIVQQTFFLLPMIFCALERIKCGMFKEPLTMFRSEGLYFDPLVYLSFWLNYSFSGTETMWYHFTDVGIHTINALFVSWFTLLLCKDKVAGVFAGLIFAVSPTNADAVIWSSSRVDTHGAFFFMSSLISYILFQRNKRFRLYYLSLIFFAISLSAKSTPIVLPLILFTVETVPCHKADYKLILLRLAPFFMIAGIYLFLLYNFTPIITQNFHLTNGLNIKSLLRGISVLFFSESLVAKREILYTGISVLFLISATVLGLFFSARTAITGFVMIITVLFPLLFMATYYLATPISPTNYLLGSIYHRLYIAVIGFSILMGAAISFISTKARIYGKSIYAAFIGVLTITIFIYGYTSIKERELLWRTQGEQYKSFVTVVRGMETYSENLSGLSNLYIIGSPYTSFTQSISRLYLENCSLNVKHLQEITEIPTSHDGKNGVLEFKREEHQYELFYHEL